MSPVPPGKLEAGSENRPHPIAHQPDPQRFSDSFFTLSR